MCRYDVERGRAFPEVKRCAPPALLFLQLDSGEELVWERLVRGRQVRGREETDNVPLGRRRGVRPIDRGVRFGHNLSPYWLGPRFLGKVSPELGRRVFPVESSFQLPDALIPALLEEGQRGVAFVHPPPAPSFTPAIERECEDLRRGGRVVCPRRHRRHPTSPRRVCCPCARRRPPPCHVTAAACTSVAAPRATGAVADLTAATVAAAAAAADRGL